MVSTEEEDVHPIPEVESNLPFPHSWRPEARIVASGAGTRILLPLFRIAEMELCPIMARFTSEGNGDSCKKANAALSAPVGATGVLMSDPNSMALPKAPGAGQFKDINEIGEQD